MMKHKLYKNEKLFSAEAPAEVFGQLFLHIVLRDGVHLLLSFS